MEKQNLEQVQKNVKTLVSLTNALIVINKRLGIPLETRYKCTEIRDGKNAGKVEENIPPLYLVDNYDYEGIVSSQLGVSPSVYLNLITHYSKDNYNEETFSVRAKPRFVEEMKQKGFEMGLQETYATVGYMRHHDGVMYYPFFEGYPRKEMHPKDVRYVAIARALTNHFGSGKIEINMKATKDGELSVLTFADTKAMLDFISQDGSKVLIGNDGRVMFMFYVTLYGDSRAQYRNTEGKLTDLAGAFVTDIKLF